MIPTGGTSGRVKFAIHNWETLAAAVEGLRGHLDASQLSSHCVLPLYHVSGFMQLFRALMTGGSVVFGSVNSFAANHDLLFEAASEERFLSLVATQLQRLSRDSESRERMRSYDAVFVGGGGISSELRDQARAWRLPLAPTYGMTETAAQVATQLPNAFLDGVEGVGKSLPHARIDVLDEAGVPAASGCPGRIRIRSESLCAGIWGEKRVENEELLTHDRGVLDSETQLSILGRIDRVIISGGEKIDLGEIEVVLERTGEVSDVVAFGIADAKWGERLCVAYAPRSEDVSESYLKEEIETKLANFKRPKEWIRLERVPRSEAGKPLLGKLKSLALGD